MAAENATFANESVTMADENAAFAGGMCLLRMETPLRGRSGGACVPARVALQGRIHRQIHKHVLV